MHDQSSILSVPTPEYMFRTKAVMLQCKLKRSKNLARIQINICRLTRSSAKFVDEEVLTVGIQVKAKFYVLCEDFSVKIGRRNTWKWESASRRCCEREGRTRTFTIEE